jgi:hypothetical protein
MVQYRERVRSTLRRGAVELNIGVVAALACFALGVLIDHVFWC